MWPAPSLVRVACTGGSRSFQCLPDVLLLMALLSVWRPLYKSWVGRCVCWGCPGLVLFSFSLRLAAPVLLNEGKFFDFGGEDCVVCLHTRLPLADTMSLALCQLRSGLQEVEGCRSGLINCHMPEAGPAAPSWSEWQGTPGL